jgi:RNA polymerase sigma-70 factor (ECF subfamily)
MAHNLTQADFTRLFTETEQPLYGFIYSLLPQRADADDVAQETVGLLWEHFADYDPQRPFLPWAMTFAYRQVLKHRREGRIRRKHFHESLLVELAAEHPQESAWDEAHQQAVKHCVARLHAKDREVLDARYFGDVTLDVLAAKLGRTANALYKQLQRARVRLAECVTRQLAQGGFE